MFALRQLSLVLACTALVLSSASAARRSLRTAGSVSGDLKEGDVGFVAAPFTSESGSYALDSSASHSFEGSYAGSYAGSLDGNVDGSWGNFASFNSNSGSSSSKADENVIVFP